MLRPGPTDARWRRGPLGRAPAMPGCVLGGKPRDLGALAAIQKPGAGVHQKPRDLPEAEHIRRSEDGEA